MNDANICPLIYMSSQFKEIDGSIEYYKNQTKNHIQSHLGKEIRSSKKNQQISNHKVGQIINYALYNEDLFSNLMTAIMLADSTWDKNKSSIHHWRNKNCIWVLNKTFQQKKRKLRNYGILSHKKLPIDELISKEENELIQSKIDSLDKRTKKIINLYYKEYMTAKNIGKIFSITQQRVDQILSQAIKKIKNVK